MPTSKFWDLALFLEFVRQDLKDGMFDYIYVHIDFCLEANFKMITCYLTLFGQILK